MLILCVHSIAVSDEIVGNNAATKMLITVCIDYNWYGGHYTDIFYIFYLHYFPQKEENLAATSIYVCFFDLNAEIQFVEWQLKTMTTHLKPLACWRLALKFSISLDFQMYWWQGRCNFEPWLDAFITKYLHMNLILGRLQVSLKSATLSIWIMAFFYSWPWSLDPQLTVMLDIGYAIDYFLNDCKWTRTS